MFENRPAGHNLQLPMTKDEPLWKTQKRIFHRLSYQNCELLGVIISRILFFFFALSRVARKQITFPTLLRFQKSPTPWKNTLPAKTLRFRGTDFSFSFFLNSHCDEFCILHQNVISYVNSRLCYDHHDFDLLMHVTMTYFEKKNFFFQNQIKFFY